MLKLNEEKLQQFASTVSSIQDKTTRSALNTLLSILEDNIPTLSLTRSGSFLPTLIPYILHPFSEKKLIPPELDFSPEEKMVEASVKSLMTWSEKQRMSVIFDSDISGLKDDSFLESLYNHSRQYVVIESSDGCVFGGYIHRRVRELNVDVEDKKAFLFSFQLDHNYTNIKYELRDEEVNEAYCVYRFDNELFISFGNGVDLQLGKSEDKCICEPFSYNKDKSAKHVLTSNYTFNPVRVLVVKMLV